MINVSKSYGRRNFLKWAAGTMGLLGGLFNPLPNLIRCVWASGSKRILPKGSDPSSLRDLNPEYLDTRNLKVMPVADFRTMGDTDIAIDPQPYRLQIGGRVQYPLSLTYTQILALPAIERNVLLVCPGIFSNHGRWKGISGKALLERVAAKADTTQVVIHGRSHSGDHEAIFPITELASDRVFLCYQVNGEPLPKKHGFPLRVVAEGHFGSEWAKYVERVELVGATYEKQNQDIGDGA